MARNRTIKPSFWSDVKVGRLTTDARLLYIGMWNFADDLGVIPADPMELKISIFPYDEIKKKEIIALLRAIESQGMIVPLTHDGNSYYALPNFSKHQAVCRPNLKSVYIPFETLCSLIDEGRKTNDAKLSKKSSKKSIQKENIDVVNNSESSAYVKFRCWCEKNAPSTLKLKRPISEEEFYKLKCAYSTDTICDYLERMDNWAPLTKRCTSAYRTLINWIKKDEQNSTEKRTNAASPRRPNTDVSSDYKESILRRMVGRECDGQI